MQHGTCRVRLSGDLNNEILKSGVTPAEILLLRQIHGDEAVLRVSARGNDKRTHNSEIDRLKAVYGEKMVKAAFPGLAPQLPVAFKDVGVDVVAEIVEDVKSARKPRADKGVPRSAAAGGTEDPTGIDTAGNDDDGDAGQNEGGDAEQE